MRSSISKSVLMQSISRRGVCSARLRAVAVVVLCLAAVLWASPAGAASLTWDANGTGAGQPDGPGAWLDANQWWSGAANATWTTGDDAIFGLGGAGGAVTLASPTVVNSLTLNSFTGTYTLGTAGQAITLNTGITMNLGAGAVTIVSPITLGGPQSWTNNSSGLLTVGTDAVDNGGNLLTIGGSGNSAVSSAIGGAGGLTKSGAGILTLSAANTYTGATTISAGTLSLTGSLTGGTAIATSGTGIINESATGTISGAASITQGSSGTSILAGTNTYSGATTISAGTLSLTGSLTGGTAIATSGTGIINESATGTISGAASITQGSSGTSILAGTNTYSGATVVSAGTLQFAKQASLYNGVTENWTAANINVKSGGTLALNVDSAGTAGFTSASLSTLLGNISVASTAAEGLQAGAKLAFDTSTANGGTLTQGNAIANSTGAFGGAVGLTKLGAGTLVLDQANTYTGPTTITTGVLQLGAGTATGALSSSGVIAIGTGANLKINRSNAAAQGTDFSGAAISGLGSFTQAGTGTTTLNVANTYSGATTVSAGILSLGNSLAIQNSALDTTASIAGDATNGLQTTVTTLTLGGLTGAKNFAAAGGCSQPPPAATIA